MARHLLMAFSNALDGLEDEFNRWYNEVHLGDVLKVPGYTAAQRFELSSTQMMPNPPYKYLAVYEVETDDLEATSTQLQSMPPEELPVTEAWDYDRCATWWFTPITERVVEES
jgi:hypothetical protein